MIIKHETRKDCMNRLNTGSTRDRKTDTQKDRETKKGTPISTLTDKPNRPANQMKERYR